MKPRLVGNCIALIVMLTASRLQGQTGTGSLTGVVNGPNSRPLSGVVVQVADLRLGNYTSEDGRYTIDRVPAGSHRIIARLPGFISDTVSVTVTADKSITQDFTLKPTSVTLQTVTISSPRLNETKAAALQQQKTADNIVSVLSGDEIRSLPNANAAEAAARMPGVTSERDEGEGKFVEVRGTPPWFQNVEIDGVHVPGTLSGDRSVKLDDVPSDLLGDIEVHKTMSADMDADAIGGTVNLVSKIPEGAPRGYLSAQYSYQTLENNSQGQGSLMYGGRVGHDNKLGFLLGLSYDRTNRVIEDVEPFWQAEQVSGGTATQINNGPGFNRVFPNDWSQREYNYFRTRYGFDGDLDYRFSPTSQVYIRGLYSAFFDQANRWVTEVSGSADSLNAAGQPIGVATGGGVGNEVSNRGPVEHTWGFTAGGKHLTGPVHLDYSANYTGSSATTNNHIDDHWDGPQNFVYNYSQSTNLVPRYVLDPVTAAAVASGSQYTLNKIQTSNEAIDGQMFGGQVNALIPFSLGNLPASFKIGAKYSNEHKGDTPHTVNWDPNNATLLTGSNVGSYNVSDFYGHICGGCYINAPFGSIPALQKNIHNSAFFTSNPTVYNDLTSTFAGTEQITSAYGMGTVDIDQLHVNVGLRAEYTHVGYVAWVDTTQAADNVGDLHATHNNHSYVNLFPSIQLRYALDENTNVRAVFSRGIARPNYSDLAPTFSPSGAVRGSFTQPIGAGNSLLQPEYSWNTDLLAEHYFPSVGVVSGGVFYKDISNFIFTRNSIYNGQVKLAPQYLPTADSAAPYYISQPQNGPHAWEYGVELDYTQHLTFLPGALRGIGFDANWTWVYSRATVPVDTTQCTCYTGAFRHAPLERQFPNLFNVSLLYDYSAISARLSGQYTAASIYGYGNDGSSNPVSGDNWNFPHWQIDGSIVWTVYGSTALQAQVLNLNNAVFGFFNGTSGNRWNIQREYYGTTLYIGVRQGL